MFLSNLDWSLIFFYFAISIAIGISLARKAGKNSTEFFAAGKQMPWWLLGISMGATTFSTDTPNLVTDIVRRDGVSGNWVWWAFLLTGMLTVFVYAQLWKRSEVLTDIEFYELRYSGKPAAFLRAFRAIYLGFFFNVVIMASVSLAAIKIAKATGGSLGEIEQAIKEVYSEKQRKWACAQKDPKFDEMCADTKISKKKVKEVILKVMEKK